MCVKTILIIDLNEKETLRKKLRKLLLKENQRNKEEFKIEENKNQKIC